MGDDTFAKDPGTDQNVQAPDEALEDRLAYQEAAQDDTPLPPAEPTDPGAGEDAPEFREPQA
jgi:hypothetical protein